MIFGIATTMKTKLFMGTRMVPDLKPCLYYQIGTELQLIPFQGKEYLGYYLQEEWLTLEQLRNHCRQFIDQMQKNLPDVRADKLPVVVFPQVFLG
jgi:hypothetical protein